MFFVFSNLDDKKNKMAVEEKEKQAEITQQDEDFSSELREPCWSVVSFETSMAKSLTYTQAEQKLKELEAAKVAGLCIITDEAASRIAKNQ
jgi:hypothetical protein